MPAERLALLFPGSSFLRNAMEPTRSDLRSASRPAGAAALPGLIAEIDQLDKNRRLVATLLETHASIGDEVAVNDYYGANARYHQAFRDYGVDLPRLSPQEAADLLRKLGGDSTVEIAAALDDWAYVSRMARGWLLLLPLVKPPTVDASLQGESLYAITRLLDPDPVRNRIRDAAASRDGLALAALAREVDPSAHPSQTVNLLAVNLYHLGQIDAAARFLEAAQPHHPGDYLINGHVAFFDNQMKKHGEALPYAMAALALRPRSASALFSLGETLSGLGRDGEALASYSRLVQWHPKEWVHLLEFGCKMAEKGDQERAAAAFRQAAASALDHPIEYFGVSEWGDRDYSGFEADPARRSSLTDELIAPLRERAAAHPESATAWMTLAEFLRCAGQARESVAAFREGFARLDPDYAEGRYFLSLFLARRGDLAGASAAFREAFRLKPDYGQPAAGNPDRIARAFLIAGRVAEAIQFQEEILETAESRLGPDHPRTNELAHFLGHGLEAAKPERAEELFRRSLAHYRKAQGPDGPLTLDLTNDLAGVLLSMGRHPEAEPILRELLRVREALVPDFWLTFSTRSRLGGSLLGQGRYPEAEPLIVEGYEGMKAREASIPQPGRVRLSEAAARVVALYRAWGKPDQAGAWALRLGLVELPDDVFARP